MDDFYYKKLDAYKLAKKLTIYVYDQIRKFPEYEKTFKVFWVKPDDGARFV